MTNVLGKAEVVTQGALQGDPPLHSRPRLRTQMPWLSSCWRCFFSAAPCLAGSSQCQSPAQATLPLAIGIPCSYTRWSTCRDKGAAREALGLQNLGISCPWGCESRCLLTSEVVTFPPQKGLALPQAWVSWLREGCGGRATRPCGMAAHLYGALPHFLELSDSWA